MPDRTLKSLLVVIGLFTLAISAFAAGNNEQETEERRGPGPGVRIISPDAALQADLDNGSTIFDNACAACHGETGEGIENVGPDLTSVQSLSDVMLVVNTGRKTMPSFNVFTDQQLLDISTFVAERLRQ